jgi:short subunit dehydrogenase-like uncharacterized protein
MFSELSTMTSQGDKVDIIVFGATGFTGKVAVHEVLKLAKEKGITWGISGRNRSKLDDVLKEVAEKTGNFMSLLCYDMNFSVHDAYLLT